MNRRPRTGNGATTRKVTLFQSSALLAAVTLALHYPAAASDKSAVQLPHLAEIIERDSLRPPALERAKIALHDTVRQMYLVPPERLDACLDRNNYRALAGFVQALLTCAKFASLQGSDAQARTTELARAMVSLTGSASDVFLDEEDIKREWAIEEDGYLGLKIEAEGDHLVIRRAYRGGPARIAGIAPGWRLRGVGGKIFGAQDVDAAAQATRGPPGSTVHVEVADSLGATRNFHLVRVRYSNVERAFDYARRGDELSIALYAFDRGVAQRLADAVAREGAGVRQIVLDLRGNTGGLLDDAVMTADLFLKKGTVAQLRGRNGIEQVFRADHRQLASNAAIEVIVDGETALGGELFAAALADNGRASLIGSPTKGMGTIRTLIMLGQKGAVLLTTQEILRSDGTPIEGHPLNVAPSRRAASAVD